MNSKQRIRARFILIIVALIGVALVANLYSIQIKNGDTYAAKADKQYTRPSSSLFDRGSIYFEARDGTRVSAGSVANGYTLYLNTILLADAESAYQAMSNYVKVDKSFFLEKAGKENDPYEELIKKLDTNTAQSIRQLDIAGLGVIKENWRTYPGDTLSANVLGIIGENKDGKLVGKYGLERYYDDVLSRKGILGSSDIFAELFSGLTGDTDEKSGNIIASIEPSVESYVEKVLVKIESDWKSDEIGAIVMDPHTGDIIAMSSYPTFDPNNVSKIEDIGVLSNPLVEHVYEMGSIMKPLTMAIGLDTGKITSTSKYDDTGTLTLDGKKISNYDGKARGIVPVQEILNQSLNIGATYVALKVGSEDFVKYFKSFKFDNKTGVDLPNEANQILGNVVKGRDIELATASYGQGIALSPIGMVTALSTLANGGYYVKPRLVKEIDKMDGTVEIIPTEKSGQLFSKQTTDEVTKMLVNVVDVALRKGEIKMEKYSIAAKTGTAQIPDPVNGGYYKDRYLHSFFGYFPAYDPKFIVFLYHLYPKGAQYASDTLTKPFAEITQYLINYYNIPPDR